MRRISRCDGAVELTAVDLDHWHHRLHGLEGFGRVGIGDQVDGQFEIDLPRDAEVLGDPAAGDGRAPGRGRVLVWSGVDEGDGEAVVAFGADGLEGGGGDAGALGEEGEGVEGAAGGGVGIWV